MKLFKPFRPIYVLATLPLLFVAVAWLSFQWRNPKANQMAFYRDFYAVITFQKIQEYQ